MATEVYKGVGSIDIPGRDLNEIQGETVTPSTFAEREHAAS
jgi:hypothetical protein